MSRRKRELNPWIHPSFSQHDLIEKNKISSNKFFRSKSFAFENDKIDLTLSPEKHCDKTILKPLCAKSSNWIEKFEPQTVDDLAVHNKKIEEVRNFLKHCDFMMKKKCPNQIVLLTGPSGAGKTATLKVLAKILDFEIVEWITPTDINVEINSNSNNFLSYKESQITLFKRFIFQSSRYRSLFETPTKRIILVEDFPNFLIRDSTQLDEILEYYKVHGKSPIAFVVTDSKSRELNISYNLFPDQIKLKYEITHISFNAIAPTLVKKALKRISSQISQEPLLYNSVDQEVLDSICVSADGDIRNAVINLNFATLKGSMNLAVKSDINKNLKKKAAKKTKKLSSVGRDETITLMHALGRVFHPKYNENCEIKSLLHSPEELTEQFSLENRHFVDFIYANYIVHFPNVENIVEAAENLSLSDNLMAEYRENCIGILGLNVAIRGLMVSNTKPTSGWAPIKGPSKQCKENVHERDLHLFGLPCNISRNIFATDMRTYVEIIKH